MPSSSMKEKAKLQNSVVQLTRLNPETEIWFDSSPLILKKWKQDFLKSVTDPLKKLYWKEELGRLYNDLDPATSVLQGVTTNPPLCLQVIKEQAKKYNKKSLILKKQSRLLSVRKRFFLFYSDIIKEGADMFMPVFNCSKFKRGYLSGQVDPRDSTDLKAMVWMGTYLNSLAPNIMVKMPGTREGINGIRIMTSLGIPTNATLTFSVAQLIAVAEAVRAGLKEARENKVDLSAWRSVVTFMLGRMEDAKDMARDAEQAGFKLTENELRWAGLAVFKKAYKIFKERKYESKLLAASMRLGPVVDGRQKVWHIEKLAGGDVVLTIFPNILEAFLKNYDGHAVMSRIDEPAPPAVMEKLLKLKYFHQAYDEDGLKPEEFINFGPVRDTGAGFNKSADEIEALIS